MVHVIKIWALGHWHVFATCLLPWACGTTQQLLYLAMEMLGSTLVVSRGLELETPNTALVLGGGNPSAFLKCELFFFLGFHATPVMPLSAFRFHGRLEIQHRRPSFPAVRIRPLADSPWGSLRQHHPSLSSGQRDQETQRAERGHPRAR